MTRRPVDLARHLAALAAMAAPRLPIKPGCSCALTGIPCRYR